jgi:soluble lytic murein transglycosylase
MFIIYLIQFNFDLSKIKKTKMKNFIKLLLLSIFLIIGISGCTKSDTLTPGAISTEFVFSGPQITPSLTLTPLPTATPTPLPVTRIENGDYALFVGDYQKAQNEFVLANQNSTDINILASADVGLARSYINQDNCPRAIEYLQKWADNVQIQSQILAKANYFSGYCFEIQNKYDSAVISYLKYIDANPGVLDSKIYEKIGDIYQSSNDQTNALIYYDKAINSNLNEDKSSIKIKIGQIYNDQFDFTNAIRIFMEVHDASPNEYTRAQMNLLAGQSYLALGLPDQAYARFQESVQNYPKSYDSYSGLVSLVEAGIPVDEFYRGLVDYYAGRYGLAIDAFNRYLNKTPDHNGSAHYYKAFALRAINQEESAITEWRTLIKDHPEDRFFVDAWEDIAYTQWAYLNDYQGAANTLLSFVSDFSSNENSPQILYDAGRILERFNQLTDASITWSRLIDEYPQADISSNALFLTGITNYRMGKFDDALSNFQRLLLLGGSPSDLAAASFWIGKTNLKIGNGEEATIAWQQAALKDPTGFYSERAKELIAGNTPLTSKNNVVHNFNLDQERMIAEVWLIQTFSLPADSNLISMEPFDSNQTYLQAKALWEIGNYQESRNLYENLRDTFVNDPANLFRLTNHFLEIGLYRSAIYSSRQILDLANMDDFQTFNAPLWFNHIRFGYYYPDLVQDAAESYNLDPLLILSLMRQESFFEGFISSSAGARGIMQIMPTTGDEIHNILKWPESYDSIDLYNPTINIRFGASYFARMRDYFDGDLFAALAAYNAGPGNVINWESLAQNDPDLFLEIIPYEETRRYLTNIYEFYSIYNNLYKNAFE